ncbi:MAG TPA: hypothetical protein VNT51_10385 [Miltoncostaeaceae bacterium]|nr:hypothetical protein [Miltoncostaeaceae bacterium]
MSTRDPLWALLARRLGPDGADDLLALASPDGTPAVMLRGLPVVLAEPGPPGTGDAPPAAAPVAGEDPGDDDVDEGWLR